MISLTGETNEMDQILLYFPFIVIFLIVLICLCRLHSDQRTDERIEAESENLEKLTNRAKSEASESSERAGEIKDGISAVSENIDAARRQIQSASEEIAGARKNNSTAAEAVSRIEEILNQAKEI